MQVKYTKCYKKMSFSIIKIYFAKFSLQNEQQYWPIGFEGVLGCFWTKKKELFAYVEKNICSNFGPPLFYFQQNKESSEFTFAPLSVGIVSPTAFPFRSQKSIGFSMCKLQSF